jgi:hypothetical protein
MATTRYVMTIDAPEDDLEEDLREDRDLREAVYDALPESAHVHFVESDATQRPDAAWFHRLCAWICESEFEELSDKAWGWFALAIDRRWSNADLWKAVYRAEGRPEEVVAELDGYIGKHAGEVF